MSGFGASLIRKKSFIKEMFRLGVRESDIVESFVRSGGPGGQNVNKASTCVYLKHLPTGIEVKCQQERTQALNRYLARRILLKKIEAFFLDKISEERRRLEKMLRQKRRRSKQARLRTLEEKRRHSQKKLLRASIREIE